MTRWTWRKTFPEAGRTDEVAVIDRPGDAESLRQLGVSDSDDDDERRGGDDNPTPAEYREHL